MPSPLVLLPKAPCQAGDPHPMGLTEDKMPKTTIPLPIADLSAYARSLAKLLDPAPSHLSLLNTLAKAAGFRNFQHLRASQKAGDALTPQPDPLADLTRVSAALRHFDAAGKMISWPARTAIQHLCLWALWARLPKESLSERAISQTLITHHDFGDPAILRRTLCELRLVTRTSDASCYERQECPPPPEAMALIKALQPRLKSSWSKYSTGGDGGA